MNQHPENQIIPENHPNPLSLKSRRVRKYLLAGFVGVLFLVWLMNTPPGLLGKTDAIGYAVCHRIGSHSFYLADRPFSLCARCTGQYLGFLWGFAAQIVLAKKRSGFPPRLVLLIMSVFFLLYLLDGLNSILQVYPGLSQWSFYVPANALRLFTGLGMGLVISGIFYPLFGQTIWKEYSLEPAFQEIKGWLILFGGGAFLGGLVLSGNSLLLYPLILLSSAGVLVLLSLLYTVIWVLITKRENHFENWDQLLWWGMAGFCTALVQIMAMDVIRYLLTGTWSGFLDY